MQQNHNNIKNDVENEFNNIPINLQVEQRKKGRRRGKGPANAESKRLNIPVEEQRGSNRGRYEDEDRIG